MNKNWTQIEDNGYQITGNTTKGFFADKQWVCDVIMFRNTETGEIKFFAKKVVEKIGLDNLKF